MKKNLFDQGGEGENNEEKTLTHAEFMEIVEEAKQGGSLKQAFLQHGITNIGYLFPDAKTIRNTPDLITRDMEWVSVVLNGIHKNPFSRIKSTAATLTADEARAKGYIKGNQKTEEVFPLLKRTTDPTTIYKKQKLYRDAIIDITEMDVVAWLKQVMQMM